MKRFAWGHQAPITNTIFSALALLMGSRIDIILTSLTKLLFYVIKVEAQRSQQNS